MLNRLNKTRLAAYYQVSVLSLAASVIYSAPYLRQLFKTSMLDAFSLTEVQLGTLSSMYGISCVLTYLPGGWLADRVAPRTLVIIALFSSAATYAWYATIPSYFELLIIHALWGVIGVGILWAALFKHIRLLVGGEEQGRMFGSFEGIRGLFEAALFTVAAFVFTLFATRQQGMINVILVYTVFATALGVLMLFSRTGHNSPRAETNEQIRLPDFIIILKEPSIWLLCIILTAVWHIFWATIEFPSFAETGGFAMPLAAATALATTKVWMRPFGGVLAGMLGDRITNVKLMIWLLGAGIVCCLFLATMETAPEFAWILWVLIFPFGLIAYGLRGILWALLYVCPIPVRTLGTAIGFISIVGYSGDIYIPLVSAWLQNNHPTGTAYQFFFAYVATVTAIGLIAAWLLGKISRPSLVE